MRSLRNEKGMALVVALMFTLICLGLITALLNMVLLSTRSSGAQSRYRSSVEAAYGGAELIANTIIPQIFGNYSSGKRRLEVNFGNSPELGLILGPNLKAKLTTPTAEWEEEMASVSPKESPDIIFAVPGQTDSQHYRVYAKVVDTIPGLGLLDGSGIDYLDATGGVSGRDPSIGSLRTPTMYTLEIQAEKSVDPKEKASLTVLYAY